MSFSAPKGSHKVFWKCLQSLFISCIVTVYCNVTFFVPVCSLILQLYLILQLPQYYGTMKQPYVSLFIIPERLKIPSALQGNCIVDMVPLCILGSRSGHDYITHLLRKNFFSQIALIFQLSLVVVCKGIEHVLNKIHLSECQKYNN